MNALKTSLDLQPARYAAILAKDIASLSRNLHNRYPDWWQSVVIELSERLNDEFHFADRPDNECPVCAEPTQTAKGELTGVPHLPWCECSPAKTVIPPWQGGKAPADDDVFKQPGMESTRMNVLDYRQNGFEERLASLESRAGVNDSDWDSDFCRVCGIDNQATHAPWCANRDGTPVAEADRFRIFALAMTAQLATMQGQLDAINRWKVEEVETWTDVLHERQIQHDKRLKALESKQSRNPA